MKIDVSGLLGKSGNRERYEETWTKDELGLDNELYSIGDSIQVSLFLHNAQGTVEVEGTYQGILHYYCNRCLKDLQESLDNEVEARFYPPERDVSEVLSETDQENRYVGNYDDDETIDVGKVIREDLVLNRPMQVLCRNDCEGLCPKCGANLNEEDCGHDTESVDPRLSKLQEIDLQEDE